MTPQSVASLRTEPRPLPHRRGAPARQRAGDVLRFAVSCRIRHGVRLHPVPRLNMCLVSVPGASSLHTLNRSEWRTLELCGLGKLPHAHAVFLRTTSLRRGDASRLFFRSLQTLVRLGLVAVDEASPPISPAATGN